MSEKKLLPRVLYISLGRQYRKADEAFSVTAPLRKKVFKKIGLKPETLCFVSGRGNFIPAFLKALKLIREKKITILYITVSGGSILEKFSLLKLFYPKLFLIWEIHGQVEEFLWIDKSLRMKLAVARRNLKRRLLAMMVDGSICLDRQLKNYAGNRLKIRKNLVIPSFLDDRLITKVLESRIPADVISKLLLDEDVFKVFWGGGAGFPWQAIDLIEKVAKKIYLIDKEVAFFIIGSNKWHSFSFFKNILLIDSLPQPVFWRFLKMSDVCLALYHQKRDKVNSIPPFHFSPLKLIEYMALAKPVIATKLGQIKQLVKDAETGFLTDNSVDDIVDKILLLKSNPAFAVGMGKRARAEILKKNSLKQAVLKYEVVFKNFGLL